MNYFFIISLVIIFIFIAILLSRIFIYNKIFNIIIFSILFILLFILPKNFFYLDLFLLLFRFINYLYNPGKEWYNRFLIKKFILDDKDKKARNKLIMDKEIRDYYKMKKTKW